MGEYMWRKLALLLLLLFLLQVVKSNGANYSAFMQETAGENKMTTNRRSSGSSGNGGDGTSNTPNPLTGGGLATPRNGAAAGHRRHNAASSPYGSSLPISFTSTALGAFFLAL